jgi:ParB family chromosome partitioning protein
MDLAKSAAAHGWSVRELEERVRRAGAGKVAKPRKTPKRAFSAELMGLEDDLMRALGARVRITRRRGGTGSISIDYHSEEELDRLANVLRTLTADAR